MIRYIPFLKAKRGELTAMGELSDEVRKGMSPFFDFPRKKEDYDSETFVETTRGVVSALKKHWGVDGEFYFDDYDVDQEISVKDQHQYSYLLRMLRGFRVIPVVSLDRLRHNDVVAQLKRTGEIASSCVAFRVEQGGFEDFGNSEDQIDYDLASVFKEFDSIDLIFDCRFCSGMKVPEVAQQIATFAEKFCSVYDSVRRVIVTGSSIPPSLGDVVDSSTTKVVERSELSIWSKARSLTTIELVGGDYATVSPFYSDADFEPELFPKVTSPRLIYSFDRSHYISRGSSLASGGYDQYLGMTRKLCEQDFFRKDCSAGEGYFYEKSEGVGGRAMNNTVVKPSVVAHITYMVLWARF